MCPFCNHHKSRVLLTENYGKLIRRRRRCNACGGEFFGAEEFAGIIKPPSQVPTQTHFNFPPSHPSTL